jgi:tight adherence protein C
MEPVQAVAAAALTAVGGLSVAAALAQRRVSTDAADWLDAEMAATAGPITHTASGTTQILRGLWSRVSSAIAARTPSAVIDRHQQQILRAGLSASMRAEELIAVNVLGAVGAVLAGVLWIALAHPPARLGFLGLVVLTVIGVCGPRVWVTRRVAERQAAIFKDLPDSLDLMVIAMEAGLSFDAAVAAVSDHLVGPLADELLRLLTEMELGLSRREALQNLKRRTDVPELNQVVISLLQADALGMPVARVLRSQAAEMRSKRRQWAREKAGKLPVKILFPLVLFIFPPVMVIILGPAFSDIAKIF